MKQWIKQPLRLFAKILYNIGEQLAQSVRAERMRDTMARFADCGDRVLIHSDVVIHGPENIQAGSNISIGEGCRIMAYGGLSIGNNVIVSRDVTIYCSDHPFDGQHSIPFGKGRVSRPVTIGDNCWIGAHARILPGSTIGEGGIVGMGTIVAGEVPALTIVGQSKFRVLGKRNHDDYEKSILNQNFRSI